MSKKTSELSGAELDYWVGMALNGTPHLPAWMLGRSIKDCVKGVQYGSGRRRFAPSTDWAQAGPIIEREDISITAPSHNTRGRGRLGWRAEMWIPDAQSFPGDKRIEVCGNSPLEAAMRCLVASKFGEEVACDV